MAHSRSSSDTSPSLVIDATSLYQLGDARVTGIERVILEIATALIDHPLSNRVAFCRFDAWKLQYVEIDRDVLLEQIVLARGVSSAPVSADPIGLGLAVRSPDRRGNVRSRLIELLRSAPTAWPHLRTSIRLAGRLGSEIVATARWAAYDIVRSLRKRVLGKRGANHCYSSLWTDSTIYCSIGHGWANNDLAILASRKADRNFRVACMVYDMIQFVRPEFVPYTHRQYFLDLFRVSDVILLTADSVMEDLIAVHAEICETAGDGLPPLGEVIKVPLGTGLFDLKRVKPDLPEGHEFIRSGNFVLCVGTITIRKNHHLLLDVWEDYVSRLEASAVPHLVIAGSRGWICEETMARLTRSSRLKGNVHHLENLTDENISWLYGNCAFTLYPSLYEGWGLPVSESHDFGKLCLASTFSSLPEASEGLAVLLDPHDRTLWSSEIMAYWQDPALRASHEREIHARHRRVAAKQTAEAVLGLVSENTSAPVRPSLSLLQ